MLNFWTLSDQGGWTLLDSLWGKLARVNGLVATIGLETKFFFFLHLELEL